MLKKFAPWFYLGIGISQTAHSIEEQLTGFYRLFPLTTGILHEKTGFIPIYNLGADGFAAANMAIITLILAFAPFVFLGKPWVRKLATIIASIELANGLYHLSLSVYLGQYFSGSIAAIGLLAFSSLFLIGKPFGKEGRDET